MSVDALIQKRDADVRAKQFQQELEINGMTLRAEDELKRVLGDTWLELQPYLQLPKSTRRLNGREGMEVSCYFEPAELDLAPFIIQIEVSCPWVEGDEIKYRTKTRLEDCLNHDLYWDGESSDALALTLHRARQQYPDWQQAKIDKAVRGCLDRLNVARGREDAQAILADLEAADPCKTTGWEARYQEKLNQFTRWEKEAAMQAENVAREEQLKAEFREAYQRYWERLQAVKEDRRRILEQIQEKYNAPIRYWKLCYAVVAADDDEDGDEEEHQSFVETDTVYVMEDQPGLGGYWFVARKGRLEPTRFTHVVAVSGPFTCRPTDEVKDLHNWICLLDYGERRLFYAPGAPVPEEAESIQLPELPKEPQADLGYHVWRQIKAEIEGVELCDEIPF